MGEKKRRKWRKNIIDGWRRKEENDEDNITDGRRKI